MLPCCNCLDALPQAFTIRRNSNCSMLIHIHLGKSWKQQKQGSVTEVLPSAESFFWRKHTVEQHRTRNINCFSTRAQKHVLSKWTTQPQVLHTPRKTFLKKNDIPRISANLLIFPQTQHPILSNGYFAKRWNCFVTASQEELCRLAATELHFAFLALLSRKKIQTCITHSSQEASSTVYQINKCYRKSE